MMRRFAYATDTSHKVVHVEERRPDKRIITAAGVNNFAAANSAIVNTAVSKHNRISSRNFGPAHSYTTALRGLSKECLA